MDLGKTEVNTKKVVDQLRNFQLDIPDPFPSTFTPFPRLPTELRLKIWTLSIRPRILHLNEVAAARAKLKLYASIPPILHVCHESRTEALKVCLILSLPRRHICIHPSLDTILWIRYNGHLTFRTDASKLDSHPSLPSVQNFAISVKFWNRITTLPQYSDLYRKFRTSESLKVLTIVDDEYGKLEWGRVEGCSVRLGSTKHGAWDHCEGGVWRKKSAEELWEKWDGGREFTEREGLVVRFARVCFSRNF